MVALPPVTPVTVPVAFTEAIEAAVLLHTPPVAASVSVVVAPEQTVDEPVIVPAAGIGLTVTAWVALAVPHAVVTV
jgi:hypothetical protein